MKIIWLKVSENVPPSIVIIRTREESASKATETTKNNVRFLKTKAIASAQIIIAMYKRACLPTHPPSMHKCNEKKVLKKSEKKRRE